MESLKVQEYMNHYPITFTPEMALVDASLRFLKTKQIGGPVIDHNHKLLGFISESDVLSKMLDTIYYNELTAYVSDIMRKEVLSVKPYDSILELAQGMLKSKPKLYPVVDEEGTLLGTISRNEVLQAFDTHRRATLALDKEHAAM
ncbi:CBS domain-containing protein [Litorilituus lipolyticus]|uniref:CBS domain-containing protein n=1 Tax=Litorilituus lipolyticus TaxID=2491017 RepID=A0A502L1W2_9GAMM|nr:CBS domain-containing protein [Litorilituus lipolyticus]TPH16465.1 CBS domain-containing protein [Litorilituus lipolyticus]